MYQTFLNKPTDDKRSPNEKAISSKLTEKLTQLNLKRIESSSNKNQIPINTPNNEQLRSSQQNNKMKRTLFICLTGVPPFPGEFQNLSFPGQMVKYVLPGFEAGISEQQRYKRALKSDLNLCSVQLNDIIYKFPQDYSLVFVCHSYGTYIASYYFKNFFNSKKDRIKGIIELGGGPIRMYKVLESFVVPILPLTKQFIIQNIDFINDKFKESHKSSGNSHVPINSYSSKYHAMSSCLAAKTQKYNELFELNKKMPKVLKLFIYGQKDYIFDNGNSDQKSIHFLYQPEAQLDEKYQKQLSNKYTKIHGQNVKNLQEKFIYKIPQGKHSLHMQKQLTPLIQKLIDDYLQIIF